MTVSRTGQVVSRAITDNFGRYRIHDLPNGGRNCDAQKFKERHSTVLNIAFNIQEQRLRSKEILVKHRR